MQPGNDRMSESTRRFLLFLKTLPFFFVVSVCIALSAMICVDGLEIYGDISDGHKMVSRFETKIEEAKTGAADESRAGRKAATPKADEMVRILSAYDTRNQQLNSAAIKDAVAKVLPAAVILTSDDLIENINMDYQFTKSALPFALFEDFDGDRREDIVLLATGNSRLYVIALMNAAGGYSPSIIADYPDEICRNQYDSKYDAVLFWEPDKSQIRLKLSNKRRESFFKWSGGRFTRKDIVNEPLAIHP